MKFYNRIDAYEDVMNAVLEKYGSRGENIVVQLRTKYKLTDNWINVTTLLLNEGDCVDPEWLWEYDWWEGGSDVELIAAAPVSDIALPDEFKFEEGEQVGQM